MDLVEYQRATRETAIYPGVGTGSQRAIEYTIVGFAGEAGEALECVKKLMRGDWGTSQGCIAYDRCPGPPECQDCVNAGGHLHGEFLAKLRKELGDSVWYLFRALEELGWTIEEIAQDNHEKLTDRAARGVIRGSGNDR